MLTAIIFRKGQAVQTETSRVDLLQAVKDPEALVWVDLQEPNDFESEVMIDIFNFHPLAVEDCLNEHSFPKMDEYDDYLFMVANGASIQRSNGPGSESLHPIELDIFAGPNYIVTFHKEAIYSVKTAFEMAKKRPSHFLGHGAEPLFHMILDQFVDAFQPVLDYFDERVELLEDHVCADNEPRFLEKFMQTKKDLFQLRRMVMPQRELIGYLTRHPTDLIPKKRIVYYRDIYDHLVRIQEVADGYHESLTASLQAYFSYSSHRLNQVIKRLTVLATLATPALIIASIYGMNFHVMPELDWVLGYPFAMGLMAMTSLVLLIWMKLKKWL